MTTFEVVYGQKPLLVISYIPDGSKVQEVEKIITVLEGTLYSLKYNFVMDENHMNKKVDQGHSMHQLVEGDQMFLHLQTYKHTSLKDEQFQNITPKFNGPYIILKQVGHVAYQLSLPSHSKINPIFHVSWLKKVIGTKCQTQTSLPELDEEGSIWLNHK